MPDMITLTTPDGFRWLHLIITLLAFSCALGYSRVTLPKGSRISFCLPALVTLVATVGIFLSGSLFTLFVFFEVMSLSSYLLVIHPRTDSARRAGGIYLAVAVIGGLSMLMGLLLIYSKTGTLELTGLSAAFTAEDDATLWVSGILLLVGFGAKAGMFPLHVWLPSSYTEAPFSGTMILSSALSKAGTFGILLLGSTLFLYNTKWGMLILLLGSATMVLGGILAVVSSNFKETLAYSSMSQIGFILVGAGMQCILGEHNVIAVRGTLLHILNHSLIKIILFAVGAVILNEAGTMTLQKLRGWGRKKPLLHIAFLLGGAAVSGVPLLSGYISKTLLHESILEYIHLLPGGRELLLFKGLESLFIISGGLTAAYIAKLYITVFLAKPNSSTAADNGYRFSVSHLIPVLLALPLVIFGTFPSLTMDKIADKAQIFMTAHLPEHSVDYFAIANLSGGFTSLAIGAFVFIIAFVLLPRLAKGREFRSWHGFSLLNSLYIPIIYYILPLTAAVLARFVDLLCSAPLRFILGLPPKSDKVYPPLNFSFGNYTEQSAPQGYISKYLPSSLKYSLLTFSTALLFALGYLIFFR